MSMRGVGVAVHDYVDSPASVRTDVVDADENDDQLAGNRHAYEVYADDVSTGVNLMVCEVDTDTVAHYSGHGATKTTGTTANRWSTGYFVDGNFSGSVTTGITDTQVVYSASGVLSGSANFTLSDAAGDVYIARSLGVGVAAPGVSSSVSIGTHGWTMAANDVAWGSSSTNRVVWDDNNGLLTIGDSGTGTGDLDVGDAITANGALRGDSLGVGVAASGNAGDIFAPSMGWDESLESLYLVDAGADALYKINVDWTSSTASTHAAYRAVTRADGAGDAIGLTGICNINSGNANAVSLAAGLNFQTTHAGSNTVTTLAGARALTSNQGTATKSYGLYTQNSVANASAAVTTGYGTYSEVLASNYSSLGSWYGSYSFAEHNAAGKTTTNVWGGYNEAQSDNGTASLFRGVEGRSRVNGGTVTTAQGAFHWVLHNGGSITNAYGTYSQVSGSANPTTAYGHYITVTAGTTKWGLYLADAVDSAFGGSLAVGSTTAPSNALDVTGAVDIGPTGLTLGTGDYAAGASGAYVWYDSDADDFHFVGDDAGANGPLFDVFHDSESPADNDIFMQLRGAYNDETVGAKHFGCWIRFVVDDATNTTLDTSMAFAVTDNSSGGDANTTATLTSLGVWTDASSAAGKTYEDAAPWVGRPYGGVTLQTACDVVRMLEVGVYRSSHIDKIADPRERRRKLANAPRHISPTAEMWRDVTGLRGPDTGIAAKDLAGLALLCIVELDERLVGWDQATFDDIQARLLAQEQADYQGQIDALKTEMATMKADFNARLLALESPS